MKYAMSVVYLTWIINGINLMYKLRSREYYESFFYKALTKIEKRLTH